MTVGLVVALSPVALGDTLSADVPAGATVLPVFDAVEFDEDFDVPRYLVMGNDLAPLEYVAVENDDEVPQSVTLAAGLPIAAEAGLPVTLWDPSVEAEDKRAVEFVAQVRLDDQDDATIPATIPHTLVPLAGVYSLEGAKVALEEDEDGDWFIARVLGRPTVIDSDYIATPKATGLLRVDTTLASSVAFTTITDFTVLDTYGVTYESATGIWRFTIPGEWLIKFDFGYAANTSGIRTGYVLIHNADATTEVGAQVKDAPVENAATAQQVIEQRFFSIGQGVSFLTKQTSGANLDLLGSNGNMARRPTAVKFVRVAT